MLKQISLITIACLSLAAASTIYTSKSLAQTIPKSQCKSDYGMTKCGYNCVSDYNVVKCADWPGGVCASDYGKVACGPPAPPNWLDAYTNPKTLGQKIPKAQCKSDYGVVKCGYNCVSDYGVVKCADWPGGVCASDYGKVVCGPPAPSNWLDAYINRSSDSTSNSGIRGTWAVTLGGWNGILHMNGIVGNLVLVSNTSGITEQKIVLNRSSEGGYVLDGEVITWHNISEKYYADHIYIQKFSKSFSARSCDDNKTCSDAAFTWLSDRSQL
jgi:hypothetical protein